MALAHRNRVADRLVVVDAAPVSPSGPPPCPAWFDTLVAEVDQAFEVTGAALMPGDALEFRPALWERRQQLEDLDHEPAKLTPYANTGHGRFTGSWTKLALEVIAAGAEDAR